MNLFNVPLKLHSQPEQLHSEVHIEFSVIHGNSHLCTNPGHFPEGIRKLNGIHSSMSPSRFLLLFFSQERGTCSGMCSGKR